MTDIKTRLQEDMKAALKAKEQKRLNAIRLIIAAIKQKQIDERIELDDTHVLAILDKMLKQRRDSFEQYQNAGRNDLAEQEVFEIKIIENYMPEKLNEAEINKIIIEAIKESNATNVKDMGTIMAIIKPKIQGRADIGQVSAQIKLMLQ